MIKNTRKCASRKQKRAFLRNILGRKTNNNNVNSITQENKISFAKENDMGRKILWST